MISSSLTATRLLSLWDRLRTSFWFMPSLMAAGAIAISFLLLQLDRWLSTEMVEETGVLYVFGPEGARAILAAIASSMITVAGLTFSITMLTLQLASSQFGPRLLRNFMRDRGNQLVLGTFIATFAYCLLVLRAVRGVEGSSFVPHVSVAFGVLLAIASLAVLIYFIHHVASSIRIETILEQLTAETRAAIDRLYPEQLGEAPPEEDADPSRRIPQDFDARACEIRPETSGYVQQVNDDAIMQIASECELVLRIDAEPGRFVTPHGVLLTAYPADRISEQTSRRLRDTLIVGQDRTPMQDLSFSIRRLVEIAQRAMSPGINDPTTAIYCLDRIGELLVHLARRRIPQGARFDEAGHLRVITQAIRFEEIARSTLAAVARYALADPDVIRHLLRIARDLAEHAPPLARPSLTAFSAAVAGESRRRADLAFDRAETG